MIRQEEKFEVIFQDDSQLNCSGTRIILRDRENGREYNVWGSGYADGLTAIHASEGTDIFAKQLLSKWG